MRNIQNKNREVLSPCFIGNGAQVTRSFSRNLVRIRRLDELLTLLLEGGLLAGSGSDVQSGINSLLSRQTMKRNQYRAAACLAMRLFKMEAHTLAAAVRRMREELRTLLRLEILDTLAEGEDVDEELCYLLRLAW